MNRATRRRVLTVAFVTVCLDLLGFGLIIPIQPFYAELYGASPSQVTWLGAVYSIMQFLFVPLWGRLSDRWGRRPILVASIGIAVVGYVLFAQAATLSMLFVARAVSGFGNANLSVARAAVADVTADVDRAQGMGVLGAAFGVGFLLGPAAGGLLGQISPTAPIWTAAVLGGLNLILAATLMPETRADSSSSAAEEERAESVPLSRSAWTLIGIALLTTSGFAMMEHTLGLFIERAWAPGAIHESIAAGGWDEARGAAAKTAQFLVVVGLVSVVIQGGLIGRLTRRYGELRLLRVGLLCLVASFIAIAVTGRIAPFAAAYVVAVTLAIGSSLSSPTSNALLSRTTGARGQGRVLSIGQSASALGRVIGPALAGPLFELSREVPLLAGAGLLAVALVATALIVPPETPAA